MKNIQKNTNANTLHTISSVFLAGKINIDHSEIIKIIRNLPASKKFVEDNFRKSSRIVRGRPYPAYEITKNGMLFFIMSLGTSRHSELRERLIESLDKDLFRVLSEIDAHDLPPDRYVYVAREVESGRYKIGISKDPSARINQLNIGNPEQLTLIHHYKATEAGYQSEAIAHALLAEHRIRGEWFDKSVDLKLLTTQPTKKEAQ